MPNEKGRWVKGESGNPKGRPPGKTPTLERAIRERLIAYPHMLAEVFDALWVSAVKERNPAALKILAERMGGVVRSNVFEREEAEERGEAAPRTVIANDEEEELEHADPDVSGQ